MRILYVATISNTLRAFLLDYARHFRSMGWTVDGLANGITKCDDCRKTFNAVWDIEWSRNPLNPVNLLRSPLTIRKLVLNNAYDLVHVHTPVAAFVTRLALYGVKPRVRTTIVYTAHGFHFQKNVSSLRGLIIKSLEKFAAKWTDFLVVINRDDYEMACSMNLAGQGRIIHMPGIGVDLARYNRERISFTDKEELRRELGLSCDDHLILMIAGFNPGKCHRDMIDALEQLETPRVHLALAGGGSLKNEMANYASSRGLSARVHFLGFRRDIPELISASSVVVLPSEREGLPRCLMEAMSLETPCIGANIRGISDLLGDSCGVLFDLHDIEQLSRAIDRVICNPSFGAEIAARARIRVDDYRIERLIEMHQNLYTEASRAASDANCPSPDSHKLRSHVWRDGT